MFSVSEKIFFASVKIFFASEKIFSVVENIFSLTKTLVGTVSQSFTHRTSRSSNRASPIQLAFFLEPQPARIIIDSGNPRSEATTNY